MEPRVYLIAYLLVIVVLQAAASTDTTRSTEVQLTSFDDVREAKPASADSENKVNNVKSQSDFDKIQSRDDDDPTSLDVSYKKYMEYLTQPSNNTLGSDIICNLPYVSNCIMMISDNIANIVQNLNTNNVQQSIDNVSKKIISHLPLTQKAKANIEEYTNSITKRAMNSTVFQIGIQAVKHRAQAAVVLLSLVTAHCLKMKDNAYVNTMNENSITTEAPSKTNEDLFKSTLRRLESGVEHIIRTHLTNNYDEQSDKKWDHFRTAEEESIQTITEQPIGQITPRLTGYLQNEQSKNERDNELDSQD